ncbi:unnamed protein product [Hermetia illucens]|uniref:Uncharacterized protein n=1 Tax=Hermetia illucens TaxID=343691 RepID=A0A7R8V0Y2_HERIL|nr:unnamed protein product [Hermetia illucens]
MEPILIVHGGAGDITEARVPGKFTGVKKAVREGFKVLSDGGSVLDAVEKAVCSMELDDNFNAGYGSVLNIEGYIEMEASIMHVARRVMEKTNHTFLGGENAMEFARRENFELLPPDSLITENAKRALEEFKENQKKGVDTTFARTELDKTEPNGTGTVGAVAIDREGNIAVATSTGGITGKVAGRIGDTPILGAGTYADNEIGGVSTTGHGETLMRFNAAQRILQKISCHNMSAQEATEAALKEMTARLVGTGGAITIDKKGQIGIYFTSKRMAWAYIKGNELHYGINAGEDFSENTTEK